MAVEILRFQPGHLDMVIRFAEATWKRPRTRAFYRWRYLECARFHEVMLAVEGGECLAVVSAFHKTYLVRGRSEACLETCDWFCRPDQIGRGLGCRVILSLTEFGSRVISFGGTGATLSLLPRMGWRTPVQARVFELPLSGRPLASALGKRTGIPPALSRLPLEAVARLWFRPQVHRGPRAGRVVIPAALGEEILPLYQGGSECGLVQLPAFEFLRWMAWGYPGTGHYLPFYFLVADKIVGWVLGRLYQTAKGLSGALVDLFSPRGDLETYVWMVETASSCLAALGSLRITAAATHPVVQNTLRRCRFLERHLIPVQCWWNGPDEDLDPMHITLNCGDDGFLPYPSAEAGAGFLMEEERLVDS